MPTSSFLWPLVGEFINRTAELDRLDSWWTSPTREPIAMIGRRRVGKSWLFRRFAHGKPAVLLVAEQLPPGAQMERFAELLEPVVGVRPHLPDVQTLFRVLFRAAATQKLLVVLDEFPWLLGATEPETQQNLSALLAVMEEERDTSKLKLIVCGSQVEQMEALFGDKNPMHGRLQRLDVRPLPYTDSAGFFADLDPVERFERYAIAGGMPMYLAKVGRPKLRDAVCREILDRDAPLFNEGRAIVEQELREPRVYFAILEQLAGGAKELNEITQPLRIDGSMASKYLSSLGSLRLVSKKEPSGAQPGNRAGRWQLDDPFLRFWFRFVFPFQAQLESGLRANDLYDNEVREHLPDHVSPVFEAWCQQWLRTNRSQVATTVGTWWGPAANKHRRAKVRTSEEIDAIGTRGSKVTFVAEAKWTNKPLTPAIVTDLDEYKIPALRDSPLTVVANPKIVLFSKAGYSDSLRNLAERDERIELVDIAAALSL